MKPNTFNCSCSIFLVLIVLGCSNQSELTEQRDNKAKSGNNSPQDQIDAVSAAVQRIGGCGANYSIEHTQSGSRAYIELNCSNRELNDHSIRHLKQLPGIVGIDLGKNDITDDGLKIIATLPDLVYLQLANTQITDKGIEILSQRKNLKRLDIRYTKVTSSSISTFAKFPSLEIVYTKGTPIESSEHVSVNQNDDLDPFFQTSD
jgi:hypothetical protein